MKYMAELHRKEQNIQNGVTRNRREQSIECSIEWNNKRIEYRIWNTWQSYKTQERIEYRMELHGIEGNKVQNAVME